MALIILILIIIIIVKGLLKGPGGRYSSGRGVTTCMAAERPRCMQLAVAPKTGAALGIARRRLPGEAPDPESETFGFLSPSDFLLLTLLVSRPSSQLLLATSSSGP